MGNLTLAWRNARKGKTLSRDVIEFEKNIQKNLIALNQELLSQTYTPRPLSTFILRDPKTRKISKSDFRDRVVHHSIINVIGPIFEKSFIYDSCANQKNKGTLFALKRFELFVRKVSNNYKSNAFCLKADIKHYFEEIDHNILMDIISKKIKDDKLIWLIRKIIENTPDFIGGGRAPFIQKGMPLGNLTSQFFANLYLNELDYFVKNTLKVRYYIRYVDDFVILHKSKEQLEIWKKEIDKFLREILKIELHPQKSRIIPLSRGVDFVGFRNFYHYRLLRKRNITTMERKIQDYRECKIYFTALMESYQGWQAYAKWANTFKLREKIKRRIIDVLWDKI